jgi:hypothetical protein
MNIEHRAYKTKRFALIPALSPRRGRIILRLSAARMAVIAGKSSGKPDYRSLFLLPGGEGQDEGGRAFNTHTNMFDGEK